MIWSPIIAAVRCLPRLRPRVRHIAPTVAPRQRLLRRAIALGCPAAAPPTAAVPPILPALPMPVPPEQVLPLPFGIGTGPLLPDALPVAGAPLPWTDIATTAAAVAEPYRARRWRR